MISRTSPLPGAGEGASQVLWHGAWVAAEQTCTRVGNIELHPQKVSKGDFIKPKDFCSEVTAYSVLQRDMRKGRFFLSFVIGIDPQGP